MKQVPVGEEAWIPFRNFTQWCNAYVEGKQKTYLLWQSSEHHYVLTPSLFLISSTEKETDANQM
jgi:hypothetical protein